MINVSSRKVYIDYLRVLSGILVIYNHTRFRGFDLFKVTQETSSFWLSVIMVPLCKIAVPIFLMISGVTLLSKQESLKNLFFRRVLRYVLIILLFGTVQYFRFFRTGKVALSLGAWFTSVYCSPILETYWFLYLYLGFLLLLPLLRKLAAGMDKKDFIYLFLINAVYSVLLVIGHFTGYFINGNVFQLTNIIVYPLLGYGIDKYGHEIKKAYFFLISVTSLIFMVMAGAFYNGLHPGQYEGLSNVIQTFTPLISCGIFGTFKALCKNKESKIICAVGSTIFGVYLIEDVVRNQIEKILIRTNLELYVNDFMVAMLFTLCAFFGSVIIVYICKKIPLINKVI